MGERKKNPMWTIPLIMEVFYVLPLLREGVIKTKIQTKREAAKKSYFLYGSAIKDLPIPPWSLMTVGIFKQIKKKTSPKKVFFS